jgi:multiple sugar transport system ATP-binding protein
MAALHIRNVKKRFGAVEILKGIDLELADGEFLVLLGPSGCGKSTLLNMIAGLETVNEGEILIDGRVVNDTHPKDRDIAMVFQSYALYPTMTVRKNIAFALKMRGVPAPKQTAAVDRVAGLLQLRHLLDRKPAQLSGGQRQRVAMGRALVRDPHIFLFDEPLSNLDAKLRIEMRTEIKKLHSSLGTTIVYVTHDQIEAMTLATRIAVMKDGLVQQFADPQTTYERPANRFVADFIGSPPMNFIPVTVIEDAGCLVLRIASSDSGGEIKLPLHEPGLALREWVGRDLTLGLRPEAISKRSSWSDSLSVSEAVFARPIELIEPTGAETLVMINLGGVETTAKLKPRDDVRKGETTDFVADMSLACLFNPITGMRI